MSSSAPALDRRQLDAHYRAALAHLDERYAHFLTHVLNMGQPRWGHQVPTAAVGVPDGADLEQFEYLFNTDFAAQLSVEELAFVMAHETMHIMLGHLALAKNFEDPRLFNLAADAAINDWLAQGGFQLPREEVIEVVTGHKLIGTDCSQLTVTEVYRALEHQQQEQEQQQGSEGGEGGGGRPGAQMGDEQGHTLDDHGWLHDSSEAQEQQAEAQVDEARQQQGLPEDVEELRDQQRTARYGGHGHGPLEQNFCEQHGVSLAWAKLLGELNPDIFRRVGPPPRPSYHRPRRKLVAHYPQVMLPVERDERRRDGGPGPSIVMALDTSGSITPQQVQMFLTLARSVPREHLHLRALTFTTAALDLDVENPTWRSGGTDFSAIEQHITQKLMDGPGARYPNAVVVVTDGFADFRTVRPQPEHEERWMWLLTDDGLTPDELTGQHFGRARPLREYLSA